MILTALFAAALHFQSAPEPHQLVYLGSGRFAQYADMATLESGRIRALQVAEADFEIGGVVYWGGWSWWAFDCDAGTMDRLDFASLRADGAEGPAMPDPAPAYVAAQGGDAFELLVAACNPGDQNIEFTTLESAVTHGRSQLAID